jgi:hypothetical protein
VAYLGWYRRRQRSPRPSPLEGSRPWRPAGAVLCAAVSILFYVGLHHLDPTQSPGWFLLLWVVVLLLLASLITMVLVDLRYTRQLVRQLTNHQQRTEP